MTQTPENTNLTTRDLEHLAVVIRQTDTIPDAVLHLRTAIDVIRGATDDGAIGRARAEAFRAAANRLTIDHPQAVLNWCADQARIALGEEPYSDWTSHVVAIGAPATVDGDDRG